MILQPSKLVEGDGLELRESGVICQCTRTIWNFIVRLSSVPRRSMAGDAHGKVEMWPQNQEEYRRLYGYGLACLGVFAYIAYGIHNSGKPKKTTTVNTTH